MGLYQYTTFDENDFNFYLRTYGNRQPPPLWFVEVLSACA